MNVINKQENQTAWKPYDGFCYPNVLVMGQSGAGKTMSICNLDPKNTIVILTEKSTLTFPNAKSFYDNKSVVTARDFAQLVKGIQYYSMQEHIDTIVIDSFTGVWRMALKLAENEFSGFAKWDRFTKLIEGFFELIKDVRQIVVCIAHSEKVVANSVDEDYEVEVLIDGKKVKALPIASWFELTLFCKKEFKTDEDVDYVFYTNALRHTPAKSPKGMLDRIIPNDLNIVVNTIKEYYK